MKVEPLTGRQARILLNLLDNPRATRELADDDYRQFWHAKFKLIGYEVLDELEERDAA